MTPFRSHLRSFSVPPTLQQLDIPSNSPVSLHNLHQRTRSFCTALAAAVVVLSVCVQAQDKTETGIEKPVKDLEKKEQAMAVGAVKELQEEVEALKLKTKNLSESLAQANAEGAKQKEEHESMRLLMEALGVSALSGSERALQTRLLDVANDYRLSEKSKKELTEQLVQLSEAAIGFMKSNDVTSKQRLENTIQTASALLRQSSQLEKPMPVALGEAKVVSFKSDLGLAVVNAGKQSGLRLGMPVSFVRKDRSVANGVIVDCRDQITGVLLTPTESGADTVVVGDTIKLEPTKKAQE